MKYNVFKKMMSDIRNEVTYLRGLPGEVDEEGMVACVTDMVIFNYFWDDKNDKPTCNFDQMKLAVKNTIRNLLRAN